MEKLQPIKRSTELAPLSREHHDTLLFAWKIKQGLLYGTPVGEIVSYAKWYWSNFLERHFQEEETLLVPPLAVNDELALQLKKEHESIRHGIEEAATTGQLSALADLINTHIRFEERTFFPHVEKELSGQQLQTILAALEQQPACTVSWPNEFWVKKQ